MFVGEAAVKAHLATLYEKFEIPEAGQQRRALLAKRAWETGAVRKSRLRGRSRRRHLARGSQVGLTHPARALRPRSIPIVRTRATVTA